MRVNLNACEGTFGERAFVGRLASGENGPDENPHAAPRRVLPTDHAEPQALPARPLLVEHRPQASRRAGKLENA